MDHSLRVWDVRKIRECVKVFDDLPNFFAHTDMAFSPDEQIFITGTSTRRGQGRGQVVFIDRTNLEIIQSVSVDSTSANRVLWHPKINQIFVGSAEAKIHALYSPSLSQKGVLLCIGKAAKKKDIEDFSNQTGMILTPHALPMFRDKTDRRKKKDARKETKPEEPSKSGPGKSNSLSYSYHQFLTKMLVRDTSRDVDPREAILKYAEQAKEPMFFKAYQKTQPVPLYDMSEYEEAAAQEAAEAEEKEPEIKKFKSSS
eukprot:TRINITY_DN7817_c0_g1_i4.p1 TRINITY_DN7817_c0_g1~~TRINITY_DN7817_c0_g1_i4.p1  ORF type:complete len:257 (-),score=72.23 TRINITY_DN7817_c0_g1_i4:32-802(-)